ncbi:MAG: ParA family protein [Thermodesulfobacteriota bacterium]
MKTISIYSMKGGVGKTASAVNLSYLAAKDGANTLICDLDPQAASTYYLRIRGSKGFNPNKFIKGGKSIDKNIKGTDYTYLDLLPSKLSYRNFDLALDALQNSKTKLKEIFYELNGDYDYLFLDCPPGISLISENVFDASDIILVPLIPTTLSVRTFLYMLKFFNKNNLDRKKIHPFFSMVEKRKSLHQQTVDTMTNKLDYFLKTQIPYRSDVEKMGIHRQPILEFASHSPASESYVNLWEEVKALG